MKNRLILVLSILFCCSFLLSCGSIGTYDDGYEDGYKAGYYAAQEKYEWDWENGFHDGMSMCREEMLIYLEHAYDYARDNSEWSVYEAWVNIMAYHHLSNCGRYENPTLEEYMESAKTLAYFCEYLEMNPLE